MAGRQINTLRKLAKQVQKGKETHDEPAVKRALNQYDVALEQYISVPMKQAKIYRDRDNFAVVERIFLKSVEFCNKRNVWLLNVAHVLFMQVSKFKEATGF